MDKLPIIMPVKNRRNLTKQTIDTLFKNTTLPFELIVISDDSDQETKDYLKSIPNIRLLLMPHSVGPGAAKNAGMSIAGDRPYYYFTDNDIYYLPNWLEILYKIFETYGDAGIVGGRTHPYHGHRDVCRESVHVRESDQQCGYSMLIKREVWLKHGPFVHYKVPEGLGREDVNFCNKVRAEGLKIYQPAEPVILHCGIKNTWGQDTVGTQSEWNQKFPPGTILE